MSDHIEHACRLCGSLLHYESKCTNHPDERGPMCMDDCPLDCSGHTLYELKALGYEELKNALKEENPTLLGELTLLESIRETFLEYEMSTTELFRKMWKVLLEEFPDVEREDDEQLLLYIKMLKKKVDYLESVVELQKGKNVVSR